MDSKEKQENDRRHSRALKLLKKAMSMVSIPDYSGYQTAPSAPLRYWSADAPPMPDNFDWPSHLWDSYKIELDLDGLLAIQLNNQRGMAWIETSLIGTAVHLLAGVEKVLAQPNADEVFQIETPEDREKGIDNTVTQILLDYMTYTPAMLSKAMEEAFKDSINRYVNTQVKPQLKDHWKQIGLPANHDVLSAWKLSDLINEAEALRKSWTGMVKPTIPESLPLVYDELRKEYAKAIRHFKASRRVFLESNSDKAWEDHWSQNCLSYFPRLAYGCLIELSDNDGQKHLSTACELAYKHLAYQYRRNPDYLKKQVSELRAIAKIKVHRATQRNRDI